MSEPRRWTLQGGGRTNWPDVSRGPQLGDDERVEVVEAAPGADLERLRKIEAAARRLADSPPRTLERTVAFVGLREALGDYYAEGSA